MFDWSNAWLIDPIYTLLVNTSVFCGKIINFYILSFPTTLYKQTFSGIDENERLTETRLYFIK